MLQESPTTDASLDRLVPARDSVRAELLRDILHGNITPLPTEDHPLSENAVMERYGQQSRMPVRMALAVLSGEGLLRQRARHGFWLVPCDLDDVEQILRMRSGIEVMVAEALCDLRIASKHTTPDELARSCAAFWEEVLASAGMMGTLADRAHGRGVDPDIEAAFADADTEFHRALAQAAGYDMAARHISEWRNKVRIFRLQQGIRYSIEELHAINAEHSALVDAIGMGDGTSAADLARSHVERVLSRERVVSAVEEVLDLPGWEVEREPLIGTARPDIVVRAHDGGIFVIEIKHGQHEANLDAVAEVESLRNIVANEADRRARGVLLVIGDAFANLEELGAEAGKADIELVRVQPGSLRSIRESLMSSVLWPGPPARTVR